MIRRKIYKIKWNIIKAEKKILKIAYEPTRYAGRVVLNEEDTTKQLIQYLEGSAPCMVARFGATELKSMVKFENISCKERGRAEAMYKLHIKSGFFPADDEKLYYRFAKCMQDACGQVDMLAVWYNMMEDYMITEYAQKPILTKLRSLEPWMSVNDRVIQNPWTKYLKGKKVLVIHPFAETISKQYKKRTQLFEGTDILPQFELYTLKAVQTLAGQDDDRFGNWFEALEWMTEQAMNVDFDIALIGCGAYGFPLAANLKMAGKKAIHMGGALQLLFGIKGQRWESSEVAKYFNDAWVRPDSGEKVNNMHLTEESCYW